MFKIGEFSKVSQVSIRSLRHYDEIGLLRPAHTDAFTGYRFYTADQLSRLNRIIALKELGLSLEEVGHVLNDKVSARQIAAPADRRGRVYAALRDHPEKSAAQARLVQPTGCAHAARDGRPAIPR